MINNEPTIKFQEGRQYNYSQEGESMEAVHMAEFIYPTKLSFAPLIKYWGERLESENLDEQVISKEIFKRLKDLPEFYEPIEDNFFLEQNSDFVKLILSGFFPSVQRELSFGAAHQPFMMKPFYVTPAMQRLMESGKLNVCFDMDRETAQKIRVIKACSFILNRFYGQQIDLDPSFIYTIEMEDSQKKGHFKAEKIIDFVDVIPTRPLKKLTQEQINNMLSNIYNEKLWLELLPPENFEFQGLNMEQLFDITEEETLSRMKYKLLEKDALVKPENIQELESDLKTFFDIPNLRMGLTAVDYPAEFTVAHKYKIRYDFLANKFDSLVSGENKNSIYEKALQWKEMMIIEDLNRYEDHTSIPMELLKQDIQNIIIAPLVNKDDRVIGLLEIGTPQPYQLTSFEKVKLKAVVPLLCMSLQRSREEIDNKIEAILREEFTALHPSVEWKFIEESFKIMEHRESDPDFSEVEEISFKDIYPLYGQADIVGSSNRRNLAIQTDLLENLSRVSKLLNFAQDKMWFPLLGHKLSHVEKNIAAIKDGISSDDESRVIEFLKLEIHPLLREIQKRDDEVETRVVSYFNKLDPSLGIIYNDRKDYEHSVAKINETISTCLMEAEKVGQKMIPHYFDEYKTDGVEYDIYVGQSLLKDGKFNELHLHNLRLWQLMLMATITRKVEKLKKKLPVPLDTAQLIFVYGNHLSVKFRLDEKRFDVDGAYNVRYEIIKKRIDKAYIEGTKDRLTVKGKIAIVYTSEKDKVEYLDYLTYLKEKGFIEGEIEDLSLAKMQGVEGLKALRVTIKH